MITQTELKKKAMAPWANGSFLRAWLRGENLFPLDIRFGKPSGKKLGTAFAEVRDWIRELIENSKEARGYGYVLTCRPINHRQLGPQQLPHRISFDTPEDWLKFIRKGTDFEDFKRLVRETRQRQPELTGLLEEKPHLALDHRKDWSRLLSICAWFRQHPRPDLYLRQLDIPGVDTKFIESRKGALTALLDRVLDEAAINRSVTGLAKSGFARRYGLKYDPPLVRLRILDTRLAVGGLTDLTLPIGEMVSTDFNAVTVFITENKINGLSFPPVPGALIVFGLGYGIELLSRIDWLKNKTIYYWGDIDTHGFAMLSRIRGYFPGTRSLLMDEETLLDHRHLWGNESKSKRFTGALSNLTTPEHEVFSHLKDNSWGDRVRLEQERIAFGRLKHALEELLKRSDEITGLT